jgi:hypothetical protein
MHAQHSPLQNPAICHVVTSTPAAVEWELALEKAKLQTTASCANQLTKMAALNVSGFWQLEVYWARIFATMNLGLDCDSRDRQ